MKKKSFKRAYRELIILHLRILFIIKIYTIKTFHFKYRFQHLLKIYAIGLFCKRNELRKLSLIILH